MTDLQLKADQLFEKLFAWKTKGNNYFKKKEYSNALAYYCEILKFVGLSPKKELQVIDNTLYDHIIHNKQLNIKWNDIRIIALKNISAIHFKLKHWSSCIDKCQLILCYQSNDIKTLFRQSQCYRKLNFIDKALVDIQKAYDINPSKEIKKALNSIQLLHKQKLTLQNDHKQQEIAIQSNNNNNNNDNSKNYKEINKYGFKKSKLYKLAQITYKGNGLIATCDIRKGHIIVKEAPFFTVNGVMKDCVQKELKNIGANDMKIIQTLSHSISISSNDNIVDILIDIMSNNCVSINHNYKGLFATICRINHSCKPNALFHWDHKTNCEFVVAITNIKKNEEITVNYISHKKYATKMKRREQMIKRYAFYCECNVCKEMNHTFDETNIQYQQSMDKYFDFKESDYKHMDIAIQDKLKENMKLIEINKKLFCGDFECSQLYIERMQLCLHPIMKKFDHAYGAIILAIKYYILNHGLSNEHFNKIKYFEYLHGTELQQTVKTHIAKFPSKYQTKIKAFLNGVIAKDIYCL